MAIIVYLYMYILLLETQLQCFLFFFRDKIIYLVMQIACNYMKAAMCVCFLNLVSLY